MRALWWLVIATCFVVDLICVKAIAASADMPQTLAIIVCKTKITAPDDDNDRATGHQNRDWDLADGKYHCRRIEMPVTSAAEQQGQAVPVWNMNACQHAALTLGPQWDVQHPDSAYRFRWVACPTPIHVSKDASSPIVGWSIPSCPYMDGMVVCEMDSEI